MAIQEDLGENFNHWLEESQSSAPKGQAEKMSFGIFILFNRHSPGIYFLPVLHSAPVWYREVY